jgi:hypothetical protein
MVDCLLQELHQCDIIIITRGSEDGLCNGIY